ncbi:MAG: DUF2851 family protein [Chlorobi bacterium]|nr:DUF2851 family protein [Chlorobiota bacterium]
MPEEFLQYIWENRLFPQSGLQTTDGEKIEIVDVGRRNIDSGPDFFNAKIRIGKTLWAGNVEIHKTASDWGKHKHQDDKAYDNVILHVVEKYDTPVLRSNAEIIPAFEIRYAEKLNENYQKLLSARTWIACQQQFYKVDLLTFKIAYHRLMIERLEGKTQEIMQCLEENHHNWNETFYQFLAKFFGFKVNAAPFQLLAKSLPLSILSKHKNNLFQIEAFLFGNAGLLNEQLPGDDYYTSLRNEYLHLFNKYGLKAIESHLWRFMRLRPVNFPTVRIAQFAALINSSELLFSKIIEIESIAGLKTLFDVTASTYWDTHYRFNKLSKKRIKRIGESSVNSIIINTVVPFLFVFGEVQGKHYLKDRALGFLEELPPEKNSIIKKWGLLGIAVRSAYDTQALLQLKNVYCETKKCLNCQIGNKFIKVTE